MNRIDLFLRPFARLVRPIYGGLGLIVMFHRVLPFDGRQRLPGHSVLEMTPDQLDEVLAWFAGRGFTPLSPDGLVAVLRGEAPRPGPVVLYTFDDGYVDNLTHALPVFQRHAAPFTVNIVTGFPERTAVLWWTLLEELVESRERIEFDLDGRADTIECTSPEARTEAFARLRKRLKYADPATMAALVKVLFVDHGLDPLRPVVEHGLSWAQLKQLAADPLVTIGAHTHSHYVLNRLSEAEARHEITESKRLLEKHLGVEVTHFAYPYGSHWEAGEREFRLAQEAGFRSAVTTRFGNLFPAHRQHLLALPRYDLPRLDPHLLDLLTSGLLAMRINRFRRVLRT
ncbi:MAG: polysaccharide deacetylase family protein [Anaerolineales bacterium]|nr:polysaccharide deacetylase family protein [Anaerolineales bacterium]